MYFLFLIRFTFSCCEDKMLFKNCALQKKGTSIKSSQKYAAYSRLNNEDAVTPVGGFCLRPPPPPHVALTPQVFSLRNNSLFSPLGRLELCKREKRGQSCVVVVKH